MEILFKTEARNSYATGVAIVDSTNELKAGEETERFLSTLTQDKWEEIPPHLEDALTRQNFFCFARLPDSGGKLLC